MTLEEMQAAALASHTKRSDIHREANKRLQAGDIAGYDTIRHTAPPPRCVHGEVSVSIVVPQNRTAYRKHHYRFSYSVHGKPVSESEARNALVADLT